MALDQASGFCKSCRRTALVARPGTNHVLHVILAFFTVGLWIPIWIISAIKIGGWRCQTCGGRAKRTG